MSNAQAEVSRGERESVELYSRLARVREVVEGAAQEESHGLEVLGATKRKTDFTLAKVAEYRRDVERAERGRERSVASQPGDTHGEVASLNRELGEAEVAAEPLQRWAEMNMVFYYGDILVLKYF